MWGFVLDCNGSILTGFTNMTKRRPSAPDDAVTAADRLAEITHLSEGIRRTLSEMADALDQRPGATPKDVLNKLNELHAVHLKVLAAEDAFHAKLGKTADHDAIDFDAIRAEIGGQLDRIRASLVASGISGASES
jgi:hypothetical protein